jgi:hypothetical protein
MACIVAVSSSSIEQTGLGPTFILTRFGGAVACFGGGPRGANPLADIAPGWPFHLISVVGARNLRNGPFPTARQHLISSVAGGYRMGNDESQGANWGEEKSRSTQRLVAPESPLAQTVS